MPIFQYRYGDGIEKAKRIIDAGIAGKLYAGTSRPSGSARPPTTRCPGAANGRPSSAACLVTHALHAARHAAAGAGPAARVFARVATRVNDIEVEDCAARAADGGRGAPLPDRCTLGSADEISRLRFCFEHVTFES